MKTRFTIALCMALVYALPVWAQTLTTPEAVLQANIEATGGAEAWAAVKTIQTEGARSNETPMGSMSSDFTTINQYPGYSWTEMQAENPMGGPVTFTMVATPEKDWIDTPMGREDRPISSPILLHDAKQEQTLLTHEAYELKSVQTDTYEEQPVYVVTVGYEGQEYKRYYHQETLLLLAADVPGRLDVDRITYRDYKSVDGLTMAHAWTSDVMAMMITMENGVRSEQQQRITMDYSLTSVTLNVAVDEGLFTP